MYYVIKRQTDSTLHCFMGFQVPKFIAAKNSDNVIFEFTKDGKAIRKWVNKEDIILLTKDKDFYEKTIKQFKAVELAQQKLVDKAREKLNESMQLYAETVNAELDEFNEIKNSEDIPCMLKGL